MDQREPREQAGQGGVGQVETGHGADLEPQTGVLPPGHVVHHGRQVDAERVQADAPQVGGDPTRTAADIGDRTVPLGAYQLGEERQDAALEGLAGEGVPQQVRVADRHGVVRSPGVVEPTGIAHAEHDSPD